MSAEPEAMTVPELFTVDEIAGCLHVHPQTVRAWIRGGELGCYKIGRYDRVSSEQLAHFLQVRRRDSSL